MKTVFVFFIFATMLTLAACGGGAEVEAIEPPTPVPTPTLAPEVPVVWGQCRETPDPAVGVAPRTEMGQRWQVFESVEIYFNPATEESIHPSHYTVKGNSYPVVSDEEGIWAAYPSISIDQSVRWIRIQFKDSSGWTKYGWIEFGEGMGMWVCPIAASP